VSTEALRRRTLHLARPDDALQVERLDFESDYHYVTRCASIRALGALWLRHPAYRFDPRHSVHADVWKPAHAKWWQQVHDAAARDRSRNPAHARAHAVRNAMGSA
jgi:hypothetical protein